MLSPDEDLEANCPDACPRQYAEFRRKNEHPKPVCFADDRTVAGHRTRRTHRDNHRGRIGGLRHCACCPHPLERSIAVQSQVTPHSDQPVSFQTGKVGHEARYGQHHLM